MIESETTMDADVETLIDEIERYLDAVELFRGEGHEPLWSCVGSRHDES